MDSFDWQKKGFVILVDEKASNVSTASDAKCFKMSGFCDRNTHLLQPITIRTLIIIYCETKAEFSAILPCRLLECLLSASHGYQKHLPAREQVARVEPRAVTRIDCIHPQFIKIFPNLMNRKL